MPTVCQAVSELVTRWARGLPIDDACKGMGDVDAEHARAIARTRMLVIAHHGRRVLAGLERLGQVPAGWRDLVRDYTYSRQHNVK